MSNTHLAYLNLGSNIQPELNLPRAIELLVQRGEIPKISGVWESQAVGTEGPNYLNACLAFKSTYDRQTLKEHVIFSIEVQLGRRRTSNKFASRTIDIDIVLFDNQWLDEADWELAYVVVPLAEIYPEYRHLPTGETAIEKAARLRREVRLEARRGILS